MGIPTYRLKAGKRKIFMHRFLLLGSVFTALISLTAIFAYQTQYQYNISSLKSNLEHRLDIKGNSLLAELEKGVVLVRFLAEQPVLFDVLDEPNDKNRKDAAKLFISLASQISAFDQIRLINNVGKEVVRINHQNGGLAEVNEKNLQDKSGRYYFSNAITLNHGSVYISRFDLNVENGIIERPLKPVVRIASPIFDSQGTAIGVAVINLLLNQLFDRYLITANQIGHDYILGTHGHYIYSEHEEKRWGEILTERNAYKLDDNIWHEISSSNQGNHLNSQGLYIYSSLNLNDSELNTKSEQILRLVTFINSDELQFLSSVSGRMYISISLASLLITWIIAWSWAKTMVSKQESFENLDRLVVEKRKLLVKHFKSQEKERKDLAQSLHDDIGQLLIAIQSHAAFISRHLVGRKNSEICSSSTMIVQTVQEVLRKIREKFEYLHPLSLTNMGLVSATETMASEWMKREEIDCRIHSAGDFTQLPHELSIRLYRIIQEALSNVVKHSNANLVEIFLVYKTNAVRLKISDNGQGFDPLEKSNGLGLIGMREFVESMDGEIEFRTAPGKGLTIDIIVQTGTHFDD